MSDPALVPFQFDSDTEHPLGQHLDDLSYDGTIPDEDIYDAINDETFGVETSLISAEDSDLADFAIRTANLALDDSPTTSSKPPDPSLIPIPQMGSDHCLHFVSSTASERHIGADSNKPVRDRMFYDRSKNANSSYADIDLSPSIWGTGTFNGINSLLDIYKGQQTFSHPMYESSNFNISSKSKSSRTDKKSPSPLTNLWPQFAHERTFPAMFGSDLESKFLREAISDSDDVVAQCASPTPISANDLERKLLQESMRNSLIEHGQKQKELSIQCQQQEKDILVSSVLSSPLSQQMTPQILNQPIFPPRTDYPPNWQQQLQHPFPLQSPGMPPPHFLIPPGMPSLQFPSVFNPMAFLQHPPPPDIARRMALHAAASTTAALQSGRQSVVTPHLVGAPILQRPPSQTMNQTPLHHLPNSPTIHSQQAMLAMVPASLHPRIEKQTKKSSLALPSGKTIADFALDPYAGLLSTKEREWLIKIHLIQCLGTGDPMTDDYYYAVWKQRNSLKKAPETWQKDARPPRYYSFDATFPSRDYIAPSFAGALGRPTHSSSCQPRQILSVHYDAEDDLIVDFAGNTKQTAATRQRRLRLILMKIEKAALALIDCRDIRRKLRFFEETAITEYIDKHEIVDRVERFAENISFINTCIFVPNQIPIVMLIQKGRQSVYDWLQFLCTKDERRQQGDNDKFIKYVCMVLETMDRWGKRIFDEESVQSFATDFCTLFTQITSRDELLSVLRSTNFGHSVINDSRLIQTMFFSLLTALIQICDSTNSILTLQQIEGSGSIYFFLFLMPASNCEVLPESTNNLSFSGVINWNFIKCWLNEQKMDGNRFVEGSVAQKICQAC
uniref:Uncharacterized protein n=2 Tax=Meloidogyne incognita group TaxID=654580 RepID=A0A915LSJ7_MELJA